MNHTRIALCFVFATTLFACDADLNADVCEPPPRGTPWEPPNPPPGDATWDAGGQLPNLGGWTSIPWCTHYPGCPHQGGDTPTPTPEPGSTGMMLAGGVCLVFSLLRTKRKT
jgi:hypothetical protein